MHVRRLNSHGVERFRQNLQQIREGQRLTLEPLLLTDDSLTETFDTEIEIEQQRFKTKKGISSYLAEKLELPKNRWRYYDVGLWTWLSVFYFDLLCPVQSGQRRVKADARYILADPKSWKRYYRHLLACPVRLYCELGELATPFLEAPIPVWRELHEQLTAHQNIATNKALIGAAGKLYWDPSVNNIKKGASTKGQGSLRRFVELIGQFELTYDVNAMNPDDILSLLPQAEFSKWISQNA